MTNQNQVIKQHIRINAPLSLIFFVTLFLCNIASSNYASAQNPRQRVSLDDGWKFSIGNAMDASKNFNYGNQNVTDVKLADDKKFWKGPAKVLRAEFNDSAWTEVNLPHDWVLTLPIVKNDNEYYTLHGSKPISSLYPENSIGWYRKKIFVPQNDSIYRYTLTFDGVYRNSRVYINGCCVIQHQSGYSSFNADITDYLRFGKENQIVVMVDATKFEGWWYEGAGIYRHAWLTRKADINIPENGLWVRADINGNEAKLKIETTIDNHSYKAAQCTVESYLSDLSGKIIARTAGNNTELATGITKINTETNAAGIKLWSIDEPNLYRVVSLIKQDGKTIDSTSVKFGFRTIEATTRGLLVNGKYCKIKGFCNHQDHAGVGIAVPNAVRLYRLQLLKELGCNAIRIHHAMAPEILDMCDSLGIFVLGETRQFGSNEMAMQEFENLIVRDRNHPSLFMWCIGNEQTAFQDTEIGKRIALTMIEKQKELDPTRTSTFGGNNGGKYYGTNSVIPVRGFNYFLDESIKYHENHPEQPVIATETSSSQSARGVYFPTKEDGYKADYDYANEEWWKIAASHDWIMGGFSWTGFDYRGENYWPGVVSNFGVMDLCGFPKNTYYYYKSWWTDKDVLHLFPHWNWKGKEGQTIKVYCHSNADNVELFLNGKSLGKKVMPRNGHLDWDVKYAAGTLKAVAYRNNRKIVENLSTTGQPVHIIATTSKNVMNANGKDNIIVNFSATDSKGREVPDAMNRLNFEISKNAKILGVGNGDPDCYEKDWIDGTTCSRKLFNGKCQVILQSGKEKGKITFTATGEGLKNCTLTFEQK
jgi:beta-galactosidase